MVLNALDEILFWNDINLLKSFIKENMRKYYPNNKENFYKEKDKFLKLHIPSKEKFINKLEEYIKCGSAVWVSGRNGVCDDINRASLLKVICVSSKYENGREKAQRASSWQISEFWDYYSNSVLYKEFGIDIDI